MVQQGFILFALALGVCATPQNFAGKEIPAKGDNGQVGGIFGLSPGTKRPSSSTSCPRIRVVAIAHKPFQARLQAQVPSLLGKTPQKLMFKMITFPGQAHTQLNISRTTP
jgi:hypothetical protein